MCITGNTVKKLSSLAIVSSKIVFLLTLNLGVLCKVCMHAFIVENCWLTGNGAQFWILLTDAFHHGVSYAVSEMTYYISSGMLNPIHSLSVMSSVHCLFFVNHFLLCIYPPSVFQITISSDIHFIRAVNDQVFL